MTPLGGTVDVIALGASAGGVEALSAVVATLPADLGAAVLIVLHVSDVGTSVMPAILDRAGRLPAAAGRDGDPLATGHVYVAPPGSHMTVEGARIRLSQEPRENGHRPAIDPLLRSLAGAFRSRAAAAILTGARDDGTAGLRQLARCGGVAIAQDPLTAQYPSMPLSAIEHVAVDAILPLAEIGAALALLAGRAAAGTAIEHSPP
ncbi:chemotaxis protein CheB [Conexibacter sp. JD483]|uniref:chemotaxis protein CheB n=1 Tax=unclassified Conexibacter TaxID=2627773 RepID=UPI002727E707|nr:MULTISPECIES: chemotaxis protein CheB [unclassified Conexibacter]MDO8188147.1 chemotaxis protein CheB [Conexibacter sp. CPCC 205706]MDO8201289.1 chemotaxis protein CheB [Conexibacter sp. CPCC 205762]MDR9370439.1 chemotaxis protein CheB [Conexibacter sp. JD483]